MNNTDLRITCALLVDGNLWLGRETGDVVVVDVCGGLDSPDYGVVHGVLTMGTERGHSCKGVHGMLRVGGDKVITCSRLFRDRVPNAKATSRSTPGKRSFVTLRSPIHQFLATHPVTIGTAKADQDAAVCNEKYQLGIWERWDGDTFRNFFKYHNDLENAS